MTFDDLERQSRFFYGFFGDFKLRDTFQERIASNSLQIDQVKLHMKFLALNVNFNCPNLDFLGSRKPAHDSIKQRYLLKVVILPLLASLP